MFRNGFLFRSIGILLLAGLAIAGAIMAYKAGLMQGMSQAPAVATAISQAAENGGAGPFSYGPTYPYLWNYPHYFGFLPLGGICLSIFFLLMLFGMLRMVLCPWRHNKRDGSSKWAGRVPSAFEEWHQKAHEERSAPGNG